MKTLNEGSKEQDKVKFLQEAAIMGQFKHPNVVDMYGVVTEGEPVSFVCSKHVLIGLARYLIVSCTLILKTLGKKAYNK